MAWANFATSSSGTVANDEAPRIVHGELTYAHGLQTLPCCGELGRDARGGCVRGHCGRHAASASVGRPVARPRAPHRRRNRAGDGGVHRCGHRASRPRGGGSHPDHDGYAGRRRHVDASDHSAHRRVERPCRRVRHAERIPGRVSRFLHPALRGYRRDGAGDAYGRGLTHRCDWRLSRDNRRDDEEQDRQRRYGVHAQLRRTTGPERGAGRGRDYRGEGVHRKRSA